MSSDLFDFVKWYLAISLLGALALPRSAAALEKRLAEDEDESVRAMTAAALGAIKDKPAAEALVRALARGGDRLRRTAADALEQIHDPQVAPALP